ncbi:MAG: NAD-dependent epimerase/dehydratase family protein [Pseudomonadota bacterium]
MRVLVTGSSGFIGSALAEELARHGHAVRGLDLAPPPPDLACALESEHGDVTDPEICRRAVRGCQAVCHLAARVGDWGPTRGYLAVNVGGTEALLGAARAEGVERFVLVSSLAVHHYGGYLDADETVARDASINAYARSKIAAEDLVRRAAGELEWVIARPGVFPFGPRDRTTFTAMAQAIEAGHFGTVNGGHALVTTAYVENLAQGLRLCLTHPAAADQTFVLGDPRAVSWRELSDLLAEALGSPPPRLNLPELVAYPLAGAMEAVWGLVRARRPPPLTRYRILLAARDCHFSSHKAADLLGYRPEVALEEGIARTVAWYRGLSPSPPAR